MDYIIRNNGKVEYKNKLKNNIRNNVEDNTRKRKLFAWMHEKAQLKGLKSLGESCNEFTAEVEHCRSAPSGVKNSWGNVKPTSATHICFLK